MSEAGADLAGRTTARLPELYLCRHGQTDWNAEGRLQGQRNIPLNEKGRGQAKRHGGHLRDVLGERAASYDFLSSPMRRACETMRIVRAELGLDPEDFSTDDRLREIAYGDWEGRTMEDLKRTDPDDIARRRADKWNFVPPGEAGESYEALSRRVGPVFRALRRPTIITAHGGITRIFLKLFTGLDQSEAATIGITQDKILHVEKEEDGASSQVVRWV